MISGIKCVKYAMCLFYFLYKFYLKPFQPKRIPRLLIIFLRRSGNLHKCLIFLFEFLDILEVPQCNISLNTPSMIRVVPCAWTHRHYQAKGCFLQLRQHAEIHTREYLTHYLKYADTPGLKKLCYNKSWLREMRPSGLLCSK